MRLLQLKKLLWILPFIMLTACGGGSGGDDPVVPPTTNPSGDGSGVDPNQPPVVQLPPECEGIGSLAEQVAAGSGKKDDNPLLICNESQFLEIHNIYPTMNASYKLMVDLTLTDPHRPFGTTGEWDKAFGGSFNGNGHTITLTINDDGEFVGLIGYSKATVNDLKVKGGIKSTRVGAWVGSIVGFSSGSRVSRVAFEGSIDCNSCNLGGLVGRLSSNLFIRDSYVNADLSCSGAGSCYVGGVLSFGHYAYKGVQNTYAMGTIRGSACGYTYLAGIASQLESSSAWDSVALQTRIVAPEFGSEGCGGGQIVQRIADKAWQVRGENGGYVEHNYGLYNMLGATGNSTNANSYNGADVTTDEAADPNWWKTNLPTWVWGDDAADPSKPWKWSNTLKRPVLWFEE